MTVYKYLKCCIFYLAALLGLLSPLITSAQAVKPNLQTSSSLQLAEELFAQAQYYASGMQADRLLAQNAQYLTLTPDNTERLLFIKWVSALKCEVPNAADSAFQQLNGLHNPAFKQRLFNALAQYYFKQNDLNKGIPFYELSNIDNLSNDEIAEGKFELAYCYFTNKQFDKAEPLFAAIKELKEGKYYAAGNYYYALLAYDNNRYNEALNSFDRIKSDPEYRQVVPYFIAEIYYFTGNRQKAIDEVNRLIKNKEKLYYDNELHLLAAQCAFEDQKFDIAIPFFEYFYEHAERIRKEEVYEMAFCYYQQKNWDKATEKFKLLSSQNDSLGQTAMYLLGDCYLKSGNKVNARSAFSLCSDLNFNSSQQEAAIFINAKLCYELGFTTEAAKQFNVLLQKFSTSQFKDEAQTLLSDLLFKSSRYAEAFNKLNEVKRKDEVYWAIHQKVCYGYAIQEISKGNFKFADSLLRLSIINATNKAYIGASWFWIAETSYKEHAYKEALSAGNKFLELNTNETAIRKICPDVTEQHAYLTLAYAAMENDNYLLAQNYFYKARQNNTDKTTEQLALLGEADACFSQNKWPEAIELYNKVITTDQGNADYAKYQKALVLGLEKNNKEKINILQGLINKTPVSRFADKARYELSLTYLESEQYQAAISILEPLTQGEKAKNFGAKAWIKTGFSYRQMGINDNAINAYKHVVTDFPTSTERDAAIDALKALYIDINQPAEYTQFLKDNNIAITGAESIDSTYYSSAEVQYINGKWDNAIPAFQQYLKQFPGGLFAVNAHYYLGESFLQVKNYRDAETEFAAVLQAPWSDFTENSARKAATIAYNAKNCNQALLYYQKLRNNALNKDNLIFAYYGLMRCSCLTDHYTESLAFADTLQSLTTNNEDMAAQIKFYKAKAYNNLSNPEDAFKLFTELQNNKDVQIAIESRYRIAQYYYSNNKLKEAEKAAQTTIQTSGAGDFWIVKSYLLIADILTKEKDFFNAEATLKSIIKQTDLPEFKLEATKKLDKLKQMEKQQSKLN